MCIRDRFLFRQFHKRSFFPGPAAGPLSISIIKRRNPFGKSSAFVYNYKKALSEALSAAASKNASRSHTTTRTDTALKRVSINSNPPITVKSFVRTFHQTRLQNSTHALRLCPLPRQHLRIASAATHWFWSSALFLTRLYQMPPGISPEMSYSAGEDVIFCRRAPNR